MRETDAAEISADNPTAYLCDISSAGRGKCFAAVHFEPLHFLFCFYILDFCAVSKIGKKIAEQRNT